MTRPSTSLPSFSNTFIPKELQFPPFAPWVYHCAKDTPQRIPLGDSRVAQIFAG